MRWIYKIPVVRNGWRWWMYCRFQKEWRKRNKDNFTEARTQFPMDIVSVGKGSYGGLNILSYVPEIERLEIGNYVSIAPDVRFILGGNHQTRTLFPYPVKSRIHGGHCREDARSKGPIVVEDEVWIGYGAIITSGVRLGKGCVIGAGAVVTKDVPPYAIAAGNPAKVIRMRLPEQVVEKVGGVALADIPESLWKEKEELLYTPLDEKTDIDALIKELRK